MAAQRTAPSSSTASSVPPRWAPTRARRRARRRRRRGRPSSRVHACPSAAMGWCVDQKSVTMATLTATTAAHVFPQPARATNVARAPPRAQLASAFLLMVRHPHQRVPFAHPQSSHPSSGTATPMITIICWHSSHCLHVLIETLRLDSQPPAHGPRYLLHVLDQVQYHQRARCARCSL